MSRIQSCFSNLAARSRKGLIPFITAGDPLPALTVSFMHALVEGGADILELGVPFSDPMADGPVIQRASERAVAQGVGLTDVLEMVQQFRKHDTHTPVVLMGYANPIEHMGVEAFAASAARVGVDGVLVVDYPPEESHTFAAALRAHAIDTIFLLAPTSTPARIREVAELASGYVYYVSLKGVTGSAALDVKQIAEKLPEIRAHLNIPLGVGFGIKDPHTARAVAEHADAVVIGSRIIEELERSSNEQAAHAIKTFIAGVREALDR